MNEYKIHVDSDVYDDKGNYITRINIMWFIEEIEEAKLYDEYVDAIVEKPKDEKSPIKYNAKKFAKILKDLLKFREKIKLSIEETKKLFKDDIKMLKEIEEEEDQAMKYKKIIEEIDKRNVKYIVMKPVHRKHIL